MLAEDEKSIPYVAGPPVELPHRFFGREELFEQIREEFRYPDRTAIALYGPRRIGKTSILTQLSRQLGPSFCSIHTDCQTYANRSLAQIIISLARSMARAAGMKGGIDIEETEQDAIGLFQDRFLPAFYKALGQNRQPVLLIDELDLLDTPSAPFQPPAAVDLIEYIQRLVEREPRLRFIIVTGRHPSELSVHFQPIFKIFRTLSVSVLDRRSTENLINTAVTEGSLSFADGAIERIISLAGCHPFFTQFLCQSLWRRAHRQQSLRQPLIEIADVEDEAAEIVRGGHGAFEWSWQQLSPAGRIIWAVMATSIRGEPEQERSISRQRLFEVVRDSGIRVIGSDIDRMPDLLVQEDLLLRTEEGNYAFRVELMRRWVKQTKPLAILRAELQKLHPHAEALFQVGLGIYQGREKVRNLARAQECLMDALWLNPNHIEARVILGRVLHEKGDSVAAIKELEEAHRYDPTAARNAQIEVLVAYAENLERHGKLDEALATYEKVLELSENDILAHDRIAAIWAQRGDEARSRGELTQAMRLYAKAGMQQKIDDVVRLIEQQRIDTLLEQARIYERAEDWALAIAAYEEILHSNSDAQRSDLQSKLDHCKSTQQLVNTYNEARVLFAQGNYRDAVQVLKEITHKNPYFRDGAELLRSAVAAALQGNGPHSGLHDSAPPSSAAKPDGPGGPSARSDRSTPTPQAGRLVLPFLPTDQYQIINPSTPPPPPPRAAAEAGQKPAAAPVSPTPAPPPSEGPAQRTDRVDVLSPARLSSQALRGLERRLWFRFLGALAGLSLLGGGVFVGVSRLAIHPPPERTPTASSTSPRPDPGQRADDSLRPFAQPLADLKKLLTDRAWESAREKANRILEIATLPPEVRQEITQIQYQAKSAANDRQHIEDAQAFIKSQDYASAASALAEIDNISPYASERDNCQKQIDNYVAQRLAQAEQARREGVCDVFDTLVDEVRKINPKYLKPQRSRTSQCRKKEVIARLRLPPVGPAAPPPAQAAAQPLVGAAVQPTPTAPPEPRVPAALPNALRNPFASPAAAPPPASPLPLPSEARPARAAVSASNPEPENLLAEALEDLEDNKPRQAIEKARRLLLTSLAGRAWAVIARGYCALKDVDSLNQDRASIPAETLLKVRQRCEQNGVSINRSTGQFYRL